MNGEGAAAKALQPVLRCSDIGEHAVRGIANKYGIVVDWVAHGTAIRGSFWGAPEAGIAGARVIVCDETPVHSLLHELCHVVCMTPERRATGDGDAGSDDLEECAVCYLQVVLAAQLESVGQARLMRDMDAWGYSFRLGTTKRWFEEDAADARAWLLGQGLLTANGDPVFNLRGH